MNEKRKEVTYNGKKYKSIPALCRELNLPESVVSHKFYRTNNIDEAVEWAKKTVERNNALVLWGKQYKSLVEVATSFGLNLSSMLSRMKDTSELEKAVEELLDVEKIYFEGKEYLGLTELAVKYGKEPSLVRERIKNGFSMERALKQAVRKQNRPDFEITYHGKVYKNKRELYNEVGIVEAMVQDFVLGYDVDFEVAVDIITETKVRANIPMTQRISYIPICIINGKHYKTESQIANDFKISSAMLSAYKSRHGHVGVLSALREMQKETVEGFTINGKRKTRKELYQLGYTSISYKDVPKKQFSRYPQLENIDLYTDCVDTKEIYEEVKNEFLQLEQRIQMNM